MKEKKYIVDPTGELDQCCPREYSSRDIVPLLPAYYNLYGAPAYNAV